MASVEHFTQGLTRPRCTGTPEDEKQVTRAKSSAFTPPATERRRQMGVRSTRLRAKDLEVAVQSPVSSGVQHGARAFYRANTPTAR